MITFIFTLSLQKRNYTKNYSKQEFEMAINNWKVLEVIFSLISFRPQCIISVLSFGISARLCERMKIELILGKKREKTSKNVNAVCFCALSIPNTL